MKSLFFCLSRTAEAILLTLCQASRAMVPRSLNCCWLTLFQDKKLNKTRIRTLKHKSTKLLEPLHSPGLASGFWYALFYKLLGESLKFQHLSGKPSGTTQPQQTMTP